MLITQKFSCRYRLCVYGALLSEYGSSEDVRRIKENLEAAIKNGLNDIRSIEHDSALAAAEPDDYTYINGMPELRIEDVIARFET